MWEACKRWVRTLRQNWVGECLRALCRGRDACGIVGLALMVAVAPVHGVADVQIGGPFELTDQNGARRTDKDFRGSYMLMFFGFTNCPDTCPTTLATMTQALEALARRDKAKAERAIPIFISVDPERDTPEVLRDYTESFHPRLVALTGTPRQLSDVARPYGVFFAKVPTAGPGRYVVDHTSFIYLIGPDGKYIQHFESDADADQILGALMRSVVTPKVGGRS
jgi:cytochrome oxidase Cu insertion factor (SCO1/SenC/PrrC family)